MILITGDLINEDPEDAKLLANILSSIKKSIKTYAIFGKFILYYLIFIFV